MPTTGDNIDDRPFAGVTPRLNTLVVAENISMRLSGETILPYHYLVRLHRHDIGVRAICHARVRDELRADLAPELFDRIEFVEDGRLQRLIFRVGRHLPYRVDDLICNQLIHILTQLRMRAMIRRTIAAHAIDVIFEPAPIAPKALSFLYGFGVPVVIGPMSGGMELPPAFRAMDGWFVRHAITAARAGADLLHRLVPGKLRATTLIVGNQRTRRALPRGTRGQIVEVMESGVDFERWEPKQYSANPASGPTAFVFCSRFVDWKGIKYLVEAFTPLAREGGARLDLVGDGELFDEISEQVAAAGIGDSVILHGHLPFDRYIDLLRASDVYVTPSLRECGGMAMMEAMAIGLPVVGLRWGGAAQYANAASALLVEPSSPVAMVAGLTAAMRTLARSPERRRVMGAAARQRIIDADLGWDSKAAQIARVLIDAVKRHRSPMVDAGAATLSRTPRIPAFTMRSAAQP